MAKEKKARGVNVEASEKLAKVRKAGRAMTVSDALATAKAEGNAAALSATSPIVGTDGARVDEKTAREARIASSKGRRSVLAEGAATSRQATFTRNKGVDVGTAIVSLGLPATTGAAILFAPETLGEATRADVAKEADRIRNVRGGKTPYYTKRAFVRFAWNDGTPQMTEKDARGYAAEGMKAAGVNVDNI